jgi:hypothetical protein
MNRNAQTERTNHEHRGRHSFLIAITIGLLVAGLTLSSCGESMGHVKGRMYVPTGLRGRAPWGEVWLVSDYDQLKRDLVEHERLLILSLMNKDAEFMRSELSSLLKISEIEAKIRALSDNRIPTQTIMPSTTTITAMTPVDTLLASVKVLSRAANPREQGSIAERIQALQDSAIVIRGRMQPSVSKLMRQRSDQKDLLLANADAIAEKNRVFNSSVFMDGEYQIPAVATGGYGLYGRYILMRWYALTPVTVTEGYTSRDIPRLQGLVTESRAVTTLDVMINQIERM